MTTTTTDKPKSSSEISAHIASLRARAEEIARLLRDLDGRVPLLADAATRGDKSAAERLRKMRDHEDALKRELANTRAAIVANEANLAEAKDREREEAYAIRQHDGEELEAEILAACEKVDAALASAAETLARLPNLRDRLRACGIVHNDWVDRMARDEAIAFAINASGLSRFLPLNLSFIHAREPLATFARDSLKGNFLGAPRDRPSAAA